MTTPIRVLIAKPGLDGHDVGARILCRSLMDAGMEVIYTGLRASPADIATVAEQEDPDVIGLSVLSGAHLPLTAKVVAELVKRELDDTLLIAGGNIPAADHDSMSELGVDRVFPTGSSLDAIVEYIEGKVGQ